MGIKVARRGMKVMLNQNYNVGEKYNGREFREHNANAKGKIIVVKDSAHNIFDTTEGSHYGVFHFDWVDELKDISNDNLITAVIMGGLSEEEYEIIRGERA